VFRFPKTKARCTEELFCIEAAATRSQSFTGRLPGLRRKNQTGPSRSARSCGANPRQRKSRPSSVLGSPGLQESLARKKYPGKGNSARLIRLVSLMGASVAPIGVANQRRRRGQKVSPKPFFLLIFNFSTPTRQLGWTRWCAQSLRTYIIRLASTRPATSRIGRYASQALRCRYRTPPRRTYPSAQLSRMHFRAWDSASYKLDYGNIPKSVPIRARCGISRGKRSTPESGYLFLLPPTVPADCEYCHATFASFSRYHVGAAMPAARGNSPQSPSTAFLVVVGKFPERSSTFLLGFARSGLCRRSY
jgi:hypothetical protein